MYKRQELSNKIKFTGHIISDERYGPDNDKFIGIAKFPHPKNLKDLRGFIGLANQLGMFIPDLAHMTSPLRPLMKRDVAWLWLQEHKEAFMKTKELLTSTSLVKPFDQSKETLMLTDTSRLYGIGFALIQKSPDGNNISLIQCGSCSLSKTQQRYATVELECLAIKWAVNKCNFYLRDSLC